MPALQVRDLPQDIYDGLVVAARRDCRSLAQEATFGIREFLHGREGGLPVASTAHHVAVLPGRDSQYVLSRGDDARSQKRKRLIRELEDMGSLSLSKDAPSAETVIRELRDAR